ncbi:MAG: hypothetical protein ACI9W2_003764 [Gammaproteobacteria bacterium]|jgi:hypothetical protein
MLTVTKARGVSDLRALPTSSFGALAIAWPIAKRTGEIAVNILPAMMVAVIHHNTPAFTATI